tara:strand:- start:2704 stop:3369 length:666 start_codon:yes stop_codon:yes gene_type:complete
MLSHIHKLTLALVFLTGCLVQTPQAQASSYHFSVDDVINMLNESDHTGLLLHIANNIYHRDKDSPVVQQKMCTHGDDVVEAWKTFGKKPKAIKSNQWRSMKQRGSLVVFTMPNIEGTVLAHIGKPKNISVKRMTGDSSSKVVIELIFSAGSTVGQKYVDTEHGAFSGRKKPGDSYSEEDLTLVKLLFDITDIIEEIRNDGVIKEADEYNHLGSITTICPTD